MIGLQLFLLVVVHSLFTYSMFRRVGLVKSNFTILYNQFSLSKSKALFGFTYRESEHSHTQAKQFLNTLPSGSAVFNTVGILLPGPTSFSFPFAFPYPLFFNKTNYSSGKIRKRIYFSFSHSPAQRYSTFLSKLVQTFWRK